MVELECARKNILTPLIKKVASLEGVSAKILSKKIKDGVAVMPANKNHSLKKPCAIGSGLRTKINANIGTSTDKPSPADEMAKLKAALVCGADAVMDLSVGGDLAGIRRRVLKNSSVPVGTVPIYEIAVNAQNEKGNFLDFGLEDVLEVLENQGRDGVDFFTVHAGVTRKSVSALKRSSRVLDIVSRGGAILAAWMQRHKKENPFYEHFDRVLDIAYKYDITLSLGDGLRPGSILDATDRPQICELEILGNLAAQARKRCVQVMIEGPGHVPLNQIKENVFLEKKICRGAPFYVLGPLVTDVACGYDHITASIGGALAASYGADFLCYVTPSEHLRHPSVQDVREGVIASRIAAHAGDIAKQVRGASDWDRRMSLARKKRDWKEQIRLALDPKKARSYRTSSKPRLSDVCTMCGKYCSIKLMEECLRV
ncbi:MAG: phosphomethylpyrimidine synthase ThiC [Deltaproteobacteria bacterium]